MKQLINRLPITRIKIFFGGLLYRIVHLVCREDKRIIVRNAITYEIDLSEGIDLSLFLFGKFQKHIFQNRRLELPEDAVIFDVGANFGAMTLQFAKLAGRGSVYAFEPTFYAYSKLKKNLELNPLLAERIVPIQSFVSSSSSAEHQIKAYASWKVAGTVSGARHPIHSGIPKAADGIGAVSLDDFCEQNQIARLDFIKIDTDGHEFEVLSGAQKIIGRFRPAIIFEVGMYIMEERHTDFSAYLQFFNLLNYSLFNSNNLKEIKANNYRKHIPSKGTIDILALPTHYESN